MPELPEVEVLVRHLGPLLKDKLIRSVRVNRAKVLRPTSAAEFRRAVEGATFVNLSRRGKYLLFHLAQATRRTPLVLVGHLGMTGRMYLVGAGTHPPKHAAVVLNLGREDFVFEDTRYFGRLTLDQEALARLGPEPLDDAFGPAQFAQALKRSKQPIKVKLLDQSLVAGIGNIYASEVLFRARVSPKLPACRLSSKQVRALHRAIREVLEEAIACGSTVPLSFGANPGGDKLFYFGRAPGAPDYYTERLRVYDRADQACGVCGRRIKHCVQAARSTYYCPHCQRK